MNANVLIYTANMGGRDYPHSAVEQDIDVEWRYLTDQENLRVDGPWRVREVPSLHDEHPNMRAKYWKTHPFFAYEHCIWVDASMEITSPSFAREAIESMNGRALATWRHPRRASIVAEASASLGRESQGGRYAELPLVEQARSYVDEGYPDDRLYACGTIVWTWGVRDVGEMWWRECLRWGYQDQISFPYVCWKCGVKPAVFPFPQIESQNRRLGYLANRWLRIWPHTRGTD